MPTIGNLGTMFVRGENGNLVPVPCIQGKNGITPHIGANGNWWIGDTDTGAMADNKKYPVSASVYEIIFTDKPSEYTLEILLKDGESIRVKLPNMGLTPDDVVEIGSGEPSEWDDIKYKQFYVDKTTGLLYINTSKWYPNSYITLGGGVRSGEKDPTGEETASINDLYINTTTGAIFLCVRMESFMPSEPQYPVWKQVGGSGGGGSANEVYVLGDGETLDDVPDGVKVVYELPEEGSEGEGEEGESNGSGGAVIPHIGENGNWFVGGTDTGVKAQGDKGEPGDDYILTEADKTEIAEQAAGLVDTALLSIIGTGEVTA